MLLLLTKKATICMYSDRAEYIRRYSLSSEFSCDAIHHPMAKGTDLMRISYPDSKRQDKRAAARRDCRQQQQQQRRRNKGGANSRDGIRRRRRRIMIIRWSLNTLVMDYVAFIRPSCCCCIYFRLDFLVVRRPLATFYRKRAA